MARETDLVSIKEALVERAEELCLDLFGTPTSKARHEWRWGRKGSLKLRLRGKGAPSIFDFSAGRGGSMLDAIALAHDLHRVADAVSWAKNWLGMPATERRKAEPRRNDAPDPEAEGERHARAIWDASRPIAETPAEIYLKFEEVGCPAYMSHESHHTLGDKALRFFAAFDRNALHTAHFLQTRGGVAASAELPRQEHAYKGPLKDEVGDHYVNLLHEVARRGLVNQSEAKHHANAM